MVGVSLLEQDLGHPKNMCAKVWFKTPVMRWTYGFGVQGHHGMGSVRWCMWGWMEFSLWSRTWGNRKPVRQSLVQNDAYDVDINFGFGVCGHLGMLLTSWCLWGRMELFFWSRDLGHPKNIFVKVWFKTPVMRWTSTLVLGSLGT